MKHIKKFENDVYSNLKQLPDGAHPWDDKIMDELVYKLDMETGIEPSHTIKEVLWCGYTAGIVEGHGRK